MFWKKNWDKPVITIEHEDGRKPWKSWTYGRVALVTIDVLFYLTVLKYLIKWIF